MNTSSTYITKEFNPNMVTNKSEGEQTGDLRRRKDSSVQYPIKKETEISTKIESTGSKKIMNSLLADLADPQLENGYMPHSKRNEEFTKKFSLTHLIDDDKENQSYNCPSHGKENYLVNFTTKASNAHSIKFKHELHKPKLLTKNSAKAYTEDLGPKQQDLERINKLVTDPFNKIGETKQKEKEEKKINRESSKSREREIIKPAILSETNSTDNAEKIPSKDFLNKFSELTIQHVIENQISNSKKKNTTQKKEGACCMIF